MRAVRLHGTQDLRFETIDPAPEPRADEVRVRVAYAGICGSDIHNYKTGQWITRSPSTAGHEFSGLVEMLGSEVAGLSIGDKIAADSRYYCNNCNACDIEDYHLCEELGFIGEAIDGGFADYVTLPSHLVHKCAPEALLDVVALAEPLAVALHAINRINIKDENPLFVVGCGPIGALVVVASKIMSDRPIFVCDQNSERADLVSRQANAQQVDMADFLEGKDDLSRRVAHVIDTTGNIAVIGNIISKVSGTTLGLVGIGSGTIDFDPVELVEREISVVGCHAFTDELPVAVELLSKHPDRFTALIKHRIKLEDTPSEYKKITKGAASGIKTLIEVADPSNEADAP